MSTRIACGGARRCLRRGRGVVCVVAALWTVLGFTGGRSWADSPLPDGDSTGRIVHVFDFDERDEGNLEDIPMYWAPLRPAGFPKFAEGAFDFSVGATAPPSLYLYSNGRNVAYEYRGPDTRVRANTEYRVEFAMRTDQMSRARACVSAFYIDGRGEPLLETMVRSPFIGGGNGSSDWQHPALTLPAAPLDAKTIGLVVWAMQESAWRNNVPEVRHIPRVDVNAGVWVDDIVIYTLPRVELTTTAPGNVLHPGDPSYLRAVLADMEGSELHGTLSVRAADGGLVQTADVPVSLNEYPQPTLVSIDHLTPGLYTAVLQVFAGQTAVVTREVSFARLADLGDEKRINAAPFGVVIHMPQPDDPEAELALLHHQLARSVKLRVWSGLRGIERTPTQEQQADYVYKELITRGFVVTGVLSDHHPSDRSVGESSRRTVVDVLGDRMDVWEEQLSTEVAPYASSVRWWQIGSDKGPPAPGDEKLSKAVSQLRVAMRRFISAPRIALPRASTVTAGVEKLPVEQVSLSVDAEVPVSRIGELLQETKAQGYHKVCAYIEPLPAGRYQRLPRLAGFAQRLVTARFEGADTVFTPQPWHTRRTTQGSLTEPVEDYLLLRTVAGLLSDTIPGRRFALASQVQCLSFYRGDVATLVMWDPLAPPEGRSYPMQLGQAERQIDVWGRPSVMARDARGRQLVRLSPMPVFVPGVEKWLIDFRTSLSIEPTHIESGTEVSTLRVRLVHVGSTPLSGDMELAPPDEWKVTPRSHTFNLMPQRQEELPIRVVYPHSEVAGRKTIVARIRFSSVPYYLEVPLTVELGLRNIEVSGVVTTEHGDVILRHMVTNHTGEILHFRGAAQVPGRQRQYRPFSNLQPGSTQTVDYRFPGVSSLLGARVRLSLREMNDGPRTHALELTVR